MDPELPLPHGSALTPLGEELAEMQAQLAHIIALCNGLDRKLDDLADQLGVDVDLTNVD
jgi:hypothetical protein